MTDQADIEPKLFFVDQSQDWQAVAVFLQRQAVSGLAKETKPWTKPKYSTSEAEVWQKTQRLIQEGRGPEAMKYSAAVVYQKHLLISLVFTIEPTELHLSMAAVKEIDKLERVADAVAIQAAKVILGEFVQERVEGVLSAVRHFYNDRAGAMTI